MNDIIRCRQCGSNYVSLYTEDCYQDVTCKNCMARTGKYGDENQCIDSWNGKGIKFYAVIWQGRYSGMLLEIWDDKKTAEKRSKKFNKEIADGKSIHGYQIDLSFGIREYTSVETIEPNIPYVRPIIEEKSI